MTRTDQVERELKLGAWPEFALPVLAGSLPDVSEGEPIRRELDAVYFDTPDLHLLRRGATLRFRRGEPPGDVWTAKLPSDAAAHGLARREITVPGRREAIPRQFGDLVRGWSLGHRLVPVARVRTQRDSLPLCDARGGVLATLDDDSVTVLRGRRVVARFREIEVELVGAAPAELISAVDERLRAAGAEKVPQIPKLGRALGRAAALPWQLAAPELGSKATMGEAAHAVVTTQLARLVDLHASVVLGGTGANETRATVRMLAAALEQLAPRLAAPPPRTLAASLDWLDAALTPLAELNGLGKSIERASKGPALGKAAAQALSEQIDAARERAHARALRALRDRRYATLLQALAATATGAPATSGPGGQRVTTASGKLARSAWREFRDADRRDTRGAIERLRPSVAIAASVPNAEATATLERVERLAALVGERDQAAAWAKRLRALARRTAPDATWAAGVVAGAALACVELTAPALNEACDELASKATWDWTA